MILERAKTKAFKLLLSIPQGSEMSVRNEGDHETWLGIGWLVGEGWAEYRGDYHFRLNKRGRAAAQEYLAAVL